jgi:hypothetical protein
VGAAPAVAPVVRVEALAVLEAPAELAGPAVAPVVRVEAAPVAVEEMEPVVPAELVVLVALAAAEALGERAGRVEAVAERAVAAELERPREQEQERAVATRRQVLRRPQTPRGSARAASETVPKAAPAGLPPSRRSRCSRGARSWIGPGPPSRAVTSARR